MTAQKQNQKGFTLLEILIVTAILGILTAIAAARFADYYDRARQGSILYDLRGCLIETAIGIQEEKIPSSCYISEHENYNDNPFIDGNNRLSQNPEFEVAGYGFVFDGRRIHIIE